MLDIFTPPLHMCASSKKEGSLKKWYQFPRFALLFMSIKKKSRQDSCAWAALRFLSWQTDGCWFCLLHLCHGSIPMQRLLEKNMQLWHV